MIRFALITTTCLLLVACSDDHDSDMPHEAGEHHDQAMHDDHGHEHGDEHEHGDGHHDHAHAGANNGGHHEGPGSPMGSVTIGDTAYAVLSHGDISAGGEAVVTIEIAEGEAPDELRAWVGQEDGRGSVKTLLSQNEQGHYHGHLEVPAELSTDAAVWLGTVSGDQRQHGRVPLPKGHDEHAGHDHGDHDHGDHDH